MKTLSLHISTTVFILAVACGNNSTKKSEGTDGVDDVPTEPVALDSTEQTYSLEQSTAALPLWTTSNTHKLRTNERPPDTARSGLHLSAARREFEPIQLILGPASSSKVSVRVDPFPDLGAEQRVEIATVGFESGWAETLTPLVAGAAVETRTDEPSALWITVYVPPSAPAGDHATTIHLEPAGGAAIDIPLTLTVFDFGLPQEIHYATQLNVDVSSLVPQGGSVDDAKTLLFEHRMTPKSVTWPSGFRWNITWDNEHSPNRCESFWDEPDESEAYSIRYLSRRYILGEGWNGVGFPNAMLFQFVDNQTPRPQTFCGIDRGDQLGTAAYNAEWSQWLTALEGYLSDNGMLEKGYYYVQNEPQDAVDHVLAAHLCRLTKAAAPKLRIAISEEPKPEIAEDPGGPCGYDIWIAHVRAYAQDYAWKRQTEHDEQVWIYSLDHDPDPYFNPTRVDADGVHQRIIPWVSWRIRARGWAYYDANRFFPNGRPTIRAELLREGFEDYEYLYLANGGAHPRPGQELSVDKTVGSVASSLTSWTKDPDALLTLRTELGRYLEGSRETLPILEADSTTRERGTYYLSFQDPNGRPTAQPLVVDGKTYTKIGWSAYDDTKGYGWYGENVDNPGIALYGYDEVAGYSEAERSYVYDDYGRDNLFEFALENGRYEVTIGVGRPARGYPNDPHNASVEGQKVVDDETTTDAAPTITRTVTVDLKDGSLSIEIGGRSQKTGNWAYTFLSFIDIVPTQ